MSFFDNYDFETVAGIMSEPQKFTIIPSAALDSKYNVAPTNSFDNLDSINAKEYKAEAKKEGA